METKINLLRMTQAFDFYNINFKNVLPVMVLFK